MWKKSNHVFFFQKGRIIVIANLEIRGYEKCSALCCAKDVWKGNVSKDKHFTYNQSQNTRQVVMQNILHALLTS